MISGAARLFSHLQPTELTEQHTQGFSSLAEWNRTFGLMVNYSISLTDCKKRVLGANKPLAPKILELIKPMHYILPVLV